MIAVDDAPVTWKSSELARVRRFAVPDAIEDVETGELVLAILRSQTPLALITAEDDPIAARIVCINAAYARLSGMSPEDVLGHSALLLAGARPDPAYLDLLRAGAAVAGSAAVRTKVRRGGGTYAVTVRVVGARRDGGDVTHRLVIEHEGEPPPSSGVKLRRG